MLPNLCNDTFWNQVKTDEAYAFLRDALTKLYEENCLCDIPHLTYSDYCIFFESGSRKEYERAYFLRRRRLAILAILCKIYPENEDYFHNLENTMWAILDEYTWALPAHFPTINDYTPERLDLFASETGYTLSEIKHMFENRLSSLMKTRLTMELDKRIIRSFLASECFWEYCDNNWAAVCAGSIGITFMYENPASFPSVKYRIDRAMENFLSGYYADGVCREGLAYWDYGFGYFCYYAEHLKHFTKGEEDLFKDAHVKTIAAFQQEMFLAGNVSVSFADGSDRASFNLGLTHFLKSEYGDHISVPPMEYHSIMDSCGRWGRLSFSLLYYRPEYTSDIRVGSRLFEDSAWYIHRETTYSFAAKGGDNAEPHNHNDLGSFIFANKDGQLLCDLGCGEYTRQYFTPDTRYTILCNSSLGHSVPIIDGKAQKEGEEYAASLTKKENGIDINLTRAYDTDAINISRSFTFSPNAATLCDTFSFEAPTQVTERFVSKIEPEIVGSSVKIGVLTITAKDKTPTVSIEMHSVHGGKKSIPVYLIDFDLGCEKETQFELICSMT